MKRRFLLQTGAIFFVTTAYSATYAESFRQPKNLGSATTISDPYIQTWLAEAQGVHCGNLLIHRWDGGLVVCRGDQVSFYTNMSHLKSIPSVFWYGIWAAVFSYKTLQEMLPVLGSKDGMCWSAIKAAFFCAGAIGCGAGAISSYRSIKHDIQSLAFTPDGFFLFNKKIASWSNISSFIQERKDIVDQSGMIVSSPVLSVMDNNGSTIVCVPKNLLPVSLEQVVDLAIFYKTKYGILHESSTSFGTTCNR